MRILVIKIVNKIVPDAWYRNLLGKTVRVMDNGSDYLVIDPSITNDSHGEWNNSGIICKLDAWEVKNEQIEI